MANYSIVYEDSSVIHGKWNSILLLFYYFELLLYFELTGNSVYHAVKEDFKILPLWSKDATYTTYTSDVCVP